MEYSVTADLAINLIKAYLSDNEFSLSNLTAEDISKVYLFMHKHDLAHLGGVIFQKMSDCEKEHYKLFLRARYIAILRHEKRRYASEQVFNLLEKNEIPFIPLKGAVLSMLYPEAWQRTSCDIDVLVKTEDLERAIKLLKGDAGYTYYKKSEHDYSFYAPNGVNLELHYDFHEETISVTDSWQNASYEEGFKYKMMLSPEFFVLHHIAHMAKHIKYGGCGLRPFIDLWFIKKNLDYDNGKLNTLLIERNLKKFSDTVFNMTENLFNSKPLNALQEELLNFVLDAGAYGSIENRVAVRHIKNKSRIKYALSRIFSKRKSLKYAYPVLEKHPWLSPFCQVHRWFKIILKGRAKSAFEEFSANHNMADEKIKRVNYLLNELEITDKGV